MAAFKKLGNNRMAGQGRVSAAARRSEDCRQGVVVR